MKQVIVRQGRVELAEVPAPTVGPGAVLVAVRWSCVSPGTELSGVRQSEVPLWKKALRRPSQVKRALETLVSEGPGALLDEVERRRLDGAATGYSAAGVVLEVGAGVEDLRPGDRVACAGAQCAHHAEVIRVPRNLCAPLPEGLDLREASTVTLGAIALQGVRRLAPTQGETFVVLGLGLLGQLTAQLLRINGCRAIGVDLSRERLAQAAELGLELGVHPEDGEQVEQVARLTGGAGADGVVITAASRSDEVVSTAFRMCRRKGRVVLVGDVGLDLNRADFFAKELDFLVSTSYGPGRYDRAYEEEGLDYPLGYVRWTENRNMAHYLDLLARGALRLAPLVAREEPLERVAEAYAALAEGEPRPLTVLLRYPERAAPDRADRRVTSPRVQPCPPGRIRLGLIGAGSFVQGVHLPLLKASGSWHLRAVAGRTGHAAALTAQRWGADYATTELAQLWEDPQLDAVLIGTRHDSHGALALAALQAGKHVLVEKPLALTEAELSALEAFYAGAGAEAPVLLTGFNRRFAPAARRLEELLRGRAEPFLASYRMNAGALAPGHWVHGPEGGGRNLGEACHVYDLFGFLADRPVVAVQAQAVAAGPPLRHASDNFVATVGFADGSLATLVYTALGSPEVAKERLEVFSDGRVFTLDDYRELRVAGSRAPGLTLPRQEKGHREELEAFARCLSGGGEWPIPLWQQLQASRIALRVEAALGPGS